MTCVRSLVRRLDAWACEPIAPHALALLRIGFAAFLLLYWGLKLPHVAVLLSAEGLHLPFPGSEAWPTFLQLLLVPPPVWVAWSLYLTLLAALVGVLVGWQLRVCGLVACVLYVYYWGLTIHLFPTSYDRLFPVLLLVISLSGADRTWSVWAWQQLGSAGAWQLIAPLPQRLIALQIAATYLGVGWQKMVLPDWQTGAILLHSYEGLWGTPLAFWLVQWQWPGWMYDQLLLVVVTIEFWLPIGLWMPRWQWLCFGLGALFHILVALLMGIWWFLILIPAYIVFLPPEQVRAWCTWGQGNED
jgi:hypothetical protein